MLVRRPRYRSLALACVLLALLAPLSLLPYLGSGSELVRLRNAWLLDEGGDAGFNWTPEQLPASFKREPGPPLPAFVSRVRQLELAALPDDWQRARRISQHLLTGSPVLHGGAIQSDLLTTYQRITSRGDGYCGDFIRAFTGLALAAGIPVRDWAFSFDGFGGHGHIWAEIWNRQARHWQLLDVFNNAYFTGADGQVLSALQLRHALQTRPTSVLMHRLVPEARPGYIEPAKAWDYYRRGLPEWYLWNGNNVFEYDQAPLVRGLGGVHRALEQIGGILSGVQPGLRVLAEPANLPQLTALRHLQWQLYILLLIEGLLGLSLLLVLGLAWRPRSSRTARFDKVPA